MKKEKKEGKALWIYRLCIVISLSITVYLLFQYSSGARIRTLRYLTKLFCMVGLFTFFGTILELRNWTGFMSKVVSPLVIFSRLPHISGISMITSLFSNKAANTMLASSYEEEQIERRSMLATGMCNGYLTFVSHSLRVMFPVVGALGLPAMLYFGTQFSLGLMITIIVMAVHRFLTKTVPQHIDHNGTGALKKVPDWRETLQRSLKRTTAILFRITVVTVPLYLFMTRMMKSNVVGSLEKFIPESLQVYLNGELMAIMIARLGGLLSAASVAGHYYQDFSLTALQIVWALLLGNIVTNPLRTLRRNLPSAMGIFPPKDGMTIVLTMQMSRFITTLSVVIFLTIFIARSMR